MVRFGTKCPSCRQRERGGGAAFLSRGERRRGASPPSPGRGATTRRRPVAIFSASTETVTKDPSCETHSPIRAASKARRPREGPRGGGDESRTMIDPPRRSAGYTAANFTRDVVRIPEPSSSVDGPAVTASRATHHHVDVEPVGSQRDDLLALGGEAGEVGGQDGGADDSVGPVAPRVPPREVLTGHGS